MLNKLLIVVVFLSFTITANSAETQITKITQFGEKGSGNDQLQLPYGVAVHPHPYSSDIFVCDTGNNSVKRFTVFEQDVQFKNSFGSSGSGPGNFYAPHAVACFLADAGTFIYILDTGNHRVQKFELNETGATFLKLWGTEGHDDNQLYFPRDLAVGTDGTVYVLDSGNGRIVKFTDEGQYLGVYGAALNMANPYGMDVDSEGAMYIADTENSRVLKLDATGNLVLTLEGKGKDPGQFRFPRDIAVDGFGNMFVADTGNYRIQKFDSNGRFLHKFGAFVEFITPQALALSSKGRLFVVDSNAHRVQGYDVAEIIYRFSAVPSPFSPDGDGIDDKLNVSVYLNESAKMVISIYDEQDNFVKNLVNDLLPGSNYRNQGVFSVQWDGKNRYSNFVPEGAYKVTVNAINKAGTQHKLYSYVTVIYPVLQPKIRVTPKSVNFEHAP